ncbi:hypothetical protein BD324DRAFT_633114 [Kockovaella imperatae]|uniref:Methyltransferase type 11 domain-containing protein n=1 Tax=Kockovaella imperatae TaxID=4999 RepID=A0A1Y1UA49_9TREE|nr:hypothetical protein BD324DRAFT_633114 [Kockovaella imperatae]ORX34899.1 hypothetical protein BD324DRAFT_633114 [Kockovaella imperatae]
MMSSTGPSKIHSVAASGFSSGTNELYDRARPSYPPEAMHTIARALPSREGQGGLKLLEVGSGTGIFTRLLLHPPSDDYPKIPVDTLIAIEPSDGMRETWKVALNQIPSSATSSRTVANVAGSFEDYSEVDKLGVGKGTVDGVLIAQAFHWCQNLDAAVREAASYLSSGSPLVFVWNIESNDAGWCAEVRNLYEPFGRISPQYYLGKWRAVFDTPAYKALFEPQEESSSCWTLPMTEDQLVERLFSKSYLTEHHLNGSARVDFEKQLRKIIREGEKEWVNKETGTFLYKYNTDVVIMRRK